MGKKARGQIGKISASEASRAVSWGGKGRPPPFPLSRLPLGSLRSPIFFFRLHRFFFFFSPNAEPGPRLVSLGPQQLALKGRKRLASPMIPIVDRK